MIHLMMGLKTFPSYCILDCVCVCVNKRVAEVLIADLFLTPVLTRFSALSRTGPNERDVPFEQHHD